MTQKTILALLLTLLFSAATVAQTAPTPPAKVNIIIDRENIRFAPQELAVEMRLVVTDQSGAQLYDSGPLSLSTLDWPLRDSQGEAVKGGLYLYTLTVKEAAGETSQRRGYLIVNRTGDADRVYVATSDKVGIGAASQVTVVSNAEATVGGAELPSREGGGYLASGRALSGLSERAGERRGIQGRAIAQADNPNKPNGPQKEARLAPSGSFNQLAKFAADGTSLVDAALYEAAGKVGLGITAPGGLLHTKSASAHDLYLENTKDLSIFFRAGVPNTVQLTVGTVSGQSALDISLATGKGLRMTTTAFPVYGVNDVYFQLNTNSPDLNAFAVIESTNLKGLALSVAEARPLIFGTARTERMRVADTGNVGIGTTIPTARLHVAGGDILFENKWRTETTTVNPGPVPGPPNLIGGFLGTGSSGATPGNRVTASVIGATIGGGGYNGTLILSTGGSFGGDRSNRVTDWFGTVGGGSGNRAGNDDATLDNARFATVGGGFNNTASGLAATVSGGANNTASISGATVSGGSSNTASSGSATVGGGFENTASGGGATVGGGEANTASGQYGVVPGGFGARASHFSEVAFASGSFSSPGDAQTSFYTLRQETANTTPTELFLAGNTERITLASNRALSFDILVVGYALGGFAGGYQLRGVIKRIGGVTTLLDSSKLILGEDISAWDANVEADSTNNALVIKVTGSGNTIRWVATVRTVEVQF